MNILIQNARVLNPAAGADQTADILIEDGRIAKIGPSIRAKEAKAIDATGLWLLPGLIDIHVHLREPGFEGKETIQSGTRAAAAGGITSLACMGNTNPPIDNQTGVDFILERVAATGIVRVYPVGAITKGMESCEIAPIGEMVEAGAVAICDEQGIMDSQVMRRAMEYSTIFHIPVLSHAEDFALSQDGFIHEGQMAVKLGLISQPAEAEAIQVARDLLLAKKTGAQVHITHISTAESVDLLRFYKKKGVNATGETAPHYLLLTDESTEDFNTNAKVNPPLRTKEDQDALFEGLRDGAIDCIASDHFPWSCEDKNVEFPMAPSGVIGLETLLPVMMNQILERSGMELAPLLRLVTDKPAKILGIPGGVLQEGEPADLTLWDPAPRYKIDKNQFYSKSKNTLFDGWEMKGRVARTFVGGKLVYDYDKGFLE
ncbi:MAG: dihydroorotase [Candidatus Omnitrophica bacterium]|nr:dihydroorotase [Candidatus Omnitrophota bacterium]